MMVSDCQTLAIAMKSHGGRKFLAFEKRKRKRKKSVVNENRGTLYNGQRNIQIKKFLVFM